MTTAVCSRAEGAEDVPLVVFPVRNHATPSERAASLRACADRYLPRLGSILFRGFRVYGTEDLLRFAAAFRASAALVTADSIWGEAGRGRVWVACTGSAETSVETRIADNRELRSLLSIATRTRLFERGFRELDFGPLLQHHVSIGAARHARAAVEPAVIADITAAYEACAMRVEWEAGDVLLVERARTSVCIPSPAQHQLRYAIDPTRPA